jgi:hypothetical protein
MNSGKPGTVAYFGSTVNYIGYHNQNGALIPVSGRAPSRIVVWYDGIGNWGLYTAYPLPRRR